MWMFGEMTAQLFGDGRTHLRFRQASHDAEQNRTGFDVAALHDHYDLCVLAATLTGRDADDFQPGMLMPGDISGNPRNLTKVGSHATRNCKQGTAGSVPILIRQLPGSETLNRHGVVNSMLIVRAS
jgi:hypothetical protein